MPDVVAVCSILLKKEVSVFRMEFCLFESQFYSFTTVLAFSRG